ncbi:MAG: hypothetical protein AUI47_06735 [Acidobacteria bacterium 13_1_40CM_2_68_5]|nr:MAG: hypothetical protein AUI47_06735 [Acidobacteria bacterium 13_1_40CM_2_68_5]
MAVLSQNPSVQIPAAADEAVGRRVVGRARRAAVALLALIGALSLTVGSTPLANLLAAPLLTVRSAPAKADVAIILAGGRYLDGSLNEASIERTVAGVRLYYQGFVPRLLFTGGPCCGGSASALMAKLAMELGVPREAILLEEQSTRTHDSAVYSVALLRRRGLRSAILVTSPLHLLRARLAFAAAGLTVHPVRSSETDLALVSSLSERIILFEDAIHEYLGLAFYRLGRWI